jgi:hypothetical protein
LLQEKDTKFCLCERPSPFGANIGKELFWYKIAGGMFVLKKPAVH